MVNSQRNTPGPPLKIEKILVPVDFSECSQKALAFAEFLAGTFKSKIIVFHVIYRPEFWLETFLTPPGDPFGLTEKLDDMVKQQVDEIKDRGIEAEGHCVIGTPYREIIKAFHEYGANMVVMGTHGRTGLDHIVLGSTAERVIALVPGPVVTIKGDK